MTSYISNNQSSFYLDELEKKLSFALHTDLPRVPSSLIPLEKLRLDSFIKFTACILQVASDYLISKICDLAIRFFGLRVGRKAVLPEEEEAKWKTALESLRQKIQGHSPLELDTVLPPPSELMQLQADKGDAITNYKDLEHALRACAESTTHYLTGKVGSEEKDSLLQEFREKYGDSLQRKNSSAISTLLSNRKYLYHRHNVYAILKIKNNYRKSALAFLQEKGLLSSKEMAREKKLWQKSFQEISAHHSPKTVQREYTIPKNPYIKVQEKMQTLPLLEDVSIAYLELRMQELKSKDLLSSQEETLLKEYQELSDHYRKAPGFYPSTLKEDLKSRYVPINAHIHTVNVEAGIKRSSFSFSQIGVGAFSDFYSLKDKERNLPQVEDAIMAKTLCTAMNSLLLTLQQEEARKTTLETGEFLFNAQSLLSTFGKEEKMILDMQKGMHNLENVTVHLTPPSQEGIRMEKKDGNLHIFLPHESAASGETRPLRFIPVFYTVGVNEMQQLARVLSSDRLQAAINRQNWISHTEIYYKRLQTGTFSPKVQTRLKTLWESMALYVAKEKLEGYFLPSVDEGALFLQRATEFTHLLGGGVSTSCKSAKDRTSQKLIEEGLQLAGERLTDDMIPYLRTQMKQEGVRLANTAKNVGEKIFAFNPFQNALLPKSYQIPLEWGSTPSHRPPS